MLQELLNQISAELSRTDHDPIKISEKEIEYAYGQMKLGPETGKHCELEVTDFCRRFYRFADIHTIFQEKKDRTLGHLTPVCLVRRHHHRHTRNKRGTYRKLLFGTHQTGKRRLPSKEETKSKCDQGEIL